MSARLKRKSTGPVNDLALPLYDPVEVQTPKQAATPKQNPQGGRSSICSEDFRERSAKLRIDLSDDDGDKRLKKHRFSPEFRFNAEMSLRVAVGVLIASAIQTRDSDYDPSVEHAKKWALFPSWYYLGGLSYCAVAVIFSAGKNVGGTVKQVCQAFYGVGMALVYNIVLFSIVDVKLYDGSYDGFFEIEKTFSSSPYWVNTHNFYTVLPWMILFTIAILLLPFENNTKKFALGNNLYFALTIINPSNPLKSSTLKTEGDPYFDTASILHNLELYFLVGFLGTIISLVVMLLPYPIFAINRLRSETLRASDDILELLNIIVDSYCFKNKNVEHMKFLKLKLHRYFEAAEARHQRMLLLLDDAWWEQMWGFNFLLKFNLSMVKHYVALVGSLIADLKSLSHAMQLEQYDQMHMTYMKVLQRDIYVIQVRSGDLLNEISREIHASTEKLHLHSIPPLEAQMETTLRRYRSALVRTLRSRNVTPKDVEGNIPLNLFLFSFESFCRTLIDFQKDHNKRKFGALERAQSFVITSIKSFFSCHRLTGSQFVAALRMAIAIVMGIFLAVYVYGFSSTTPAAVAYVMGTHMGGSFSVTVNRVGGVVAGSVVPSVFQFFILQICDPRFLNIFLSSAVLFFWVTMSMYVNFSGGYGAYAGLVSAFISAGILLRQSDVCYAGGSDSSSSIAISSYSSMAQTSVGIILFILVELAMCPESATSLLRKNIQKTLDKQKEAFEKLFMHHLSTSNTMDSDAMEKLRKILQVEVPALLVEQGKLLKEAQSEPQLWKPALSTQKYESVLDCLEDLTISNNLLLRLERWFSYRVKHHGAHLSIEIQDSGSVNVDEDDDDESAENKEAHPDMSKFELWTTASRQFLSAVGDKFSTLHNVFSEEFPYSDPEQTALFMQMKEAFRNADKDCSGHIDSHEVATMLETIFTQSGAIHEDEIPKYVSEFMNAVDKDASGMVSFEEFMEALDSGLKLEVEVYQRRKPKAAALTRQRSLAPSRAARATRANASHLDRIVEETTTTAQTFRSSMTTGSSAAAAETVAAVDAALASMDLSTPVAAAPAKPENVPSPAPSPVARGLRTLPSNASAPLMSPMRRAHDILNVEDFSIQGIAERMKLAYVVWLLEDQRFARVSMEELLLFSCLVSGAEGVALNLTSMEKIVASA